MDKARKKELLRQFRDSEKNGFLASLPMPVGKFAQLFDYLDESDEECAGDLRRTEAFLKAQHCPVEPVIQWLHEHGAGCDCEVLMNVEEQFEDYLP